MTTILLIAPVTIAICDDLELDPRPFLITQVIASNIGGTATLIGDPPNILIGGATGLDFIAFLLNLAPVVLVLLVLMLGRVLARLLAARAASARHQPRASGRWRRPTPASTSATGGCCGARSSCWD